MRQVIVETSRVKSLLFEITGWQGHLPGQHVDIRLIGEDGYQAQRSYSIASPPEDELIALTVERVENGEVSPYLVDELPEGDQFDCGGRSAATSFGASPWAVRCVSSRLDRESRGPRCSEWVKSRRSNDASSMRVRRRDPNGRRLPESARGPLRRPVTHDLENCRRFPVTFQIASLAAERS